tara:strand:+ start:984 stop:1253 length:270 start_codon:yes stop_codon:yes gene_type:complete
MLRYFFSRSIRMVIDSVDDLTIAPGVEAEETLYAFRDAVVTDLVSFDEYLPEDSVFLEAPEARRLHDAKRNVYVAIIELIDAQISAITR